MVSSVANPARLLKLVGIYQDKYLDVGTAELDDLLAYGKEYNTWFIETAMPFMESQLVIDKGVRTVTDASPAAASAIGQFVKDGAAGIVNGVSAWLTEGDDPNAAKFWRAGIDLWKLNREMLGEKVPRKTTLDSDDLNMLDVYVRSFIDTWLGHCEKHRREVQRRVNTAQLNGWTTQQFIERMIAPDGNVVGFMYGNARLSFTEHLRRFGTGKSRMLAQAALEGRMARG